jgi:hypothetical protein
VLGELVERAGLAQRGEVAPQAPLRLQPEGAVDRRGAQPDQVRAPTQPFADRAVIERRHPDEGRDRSVRKRVVATARQSNARTYLASPHHRRMVYRPSRRGASARRICRPQHPTRPGRAMIGGVDCGWS